jgi:digeranylgeranylglycerophospholipid reductase
MKSFLKDVIVIGGGPSGLQFARRMAAEGFDVEVLEEHTSAGEPVHCTGIVAPEIFQEFSIPSTSTLHDLTMARFFSPKGRVIRYQTDSVQAVVVDRCAFDRNLRDLACASGAQIQYGVRALRIEITETGATVHCSANAVHKGRAIVIATGSSYTLNRCLGIGLPPVFLNCAQIELPSIHPRDLEIHLGCEVAPKGFAWALPVHRKQGSFARIGIMCDGNAEQFLKGFLPRLKPWAIQNEFERPLRPRILPLAPIRKTYGNRLLVIGDAAGFVKPTTGGGVFYGMISAGIAAEVLAKALRSGLLGESDLSAYQTLWKERLMEEIQAQLTLRLLMQRLTDNEIESIFDLWMTDGLMPLIRKTASFNHHRKLIFAITRYPAMRKILFRKALDGCSKFE